ncbi:2854_t:CDS:2, partial [Racocetra persica]
PNYEARILAALKDKTEKLTFIIVNGENIQGSEDPEQNEKFINSELKKQLCQNCSICSNCRNQKRSQIEKLQAAGRVGGERIIKPFLEHFQNKLEAGGNKTVNFEDINERPTQPPGSQSCGFYVLYYIKKLIESSDLLETGIPSVENLFKDDTGTAIVGEEKEAEIKNQEEVLRFRRFRFPGEQTRESLQAESSTTVAKGKSTKLMETESSEGEFESDDDLDGVLEEVLHKPYCGEDNCRRIYSSLQEKENELISLRSICGSLQEENNNLQAIKIAAADHENAAREAKEKINSLSSEIKALQSSNSTLQQEKAQKETEI